jgi:hypothetical protein
MDEMVKALGAGDGRRGLGLGLAVSGQVVFELMDTFDRGLW